jgi:hypothetical protein
MLTKVKYVHLTIKVNTEQAIIDFSETIEINPKSVDFYFGRAGIKHSNGDREGEYAELKKAAYLGFERAKIFMPKIVNNNYW